MQPQNYIHGVSASHAVCNYVPDEFCLDILIVFSKVYKMEKLNHNMKDIYITLEDS